jgi:hypothetical protein
VSALQTKFLFFCCCVHLIGLLTLSILLYTECMETLCQYFSMSFLKLSSASNVKWTLSDCQRSRSCGQKLKMIWTAQNTIADVLPAWRGTSRVSRHETEKQNGKFPDRWIGRGDPENWPLRSPDLTSSRYPRFCYCMKSTVCERKVKRREELHLRIFYAARRINDPRKIQIMNFKYP